ncbi:hypothetical protein [Beggiatoa leptomitoformis]|uniref:Uncharacterized protein n=1 Tax=Beggiatoa leptomitoformis TaxID=288004 RepID=A0A2N9YAN8_9GAMM|nr:hypothetical protein [Beggiatoa leptomitoformis]ALG67098.1 hypothetical protein AL038_04445 [Beggiatoa leptomitoformis]AUI67509.1 hypothetical protein BLE401_01560 [Beggiatoa leptomitoformis]
MKKYFLLLSTLLLMFNINSAFAKAEKVTICHKGKHTITVSESALPAHLKNGSTIGACEDDGNEDDSTDVDDDLGNPTTTQAVIVVIVDATGNPSTVGTSITINFSILTATTISKIPAAVFALFKADQLALIPEDALEGLTVEQIKFLRPIAFTGFTVKQVVKLSINIFTVLTASQVAGFEPETIVGLSATQIAKIKPAACMGLSKSQIAAINKETVKGITATQLSYITYTAIGGFSTAQFQNLSLESLAGLTTSNVAGLDKEIYGEMGSELLTLLGTTVVSSLALEDLTVIVFSLDFTKVTISTIYKYLPTTWIINPFNGKIKFPKGKITLPKFKLKKSESVVVSLPEGIPDLNVSLTLNEDTSLQDTIINVVNRTLISLNYANFTVAQDDGLISVMGTGSAEGVELSLLPDEDGVEQVDDNEPAGLTIDDEGKYLLTTLEGIRLTLIPAPRKTVYFNNIGLKIRVKKKGEVRLEIPKLNRVVSAVFSPFIVKAPVGMAQGVTFSEDGTTLYVVFEDGMMQTASPMVIDRDIMVLARNLLPDAFRYGDYKFLANGKINFVYNGLLIESSPTFDIKIGYSVKRLSPVINLVKMAEEADLVTEEGERQLFKLRVIGKPSDL